MGVVVPDKLIASVALPAQIGSAAVTVVFSIWELRATNAIRTAGTLAHMQLELLLGGLNTKFAGLPVGIGVF